MVFALFVPVLFLYIENLSYFILSFSEIVVLKEGAENADKELQKALKVNASV